MTPEQEARQDIDQLLEAAGWSIQDYKQLNLGASIGVAIREFPLTSGFAADYLLFVDRKAAGVIEAKPYGTTLSGVETQTAKYANSVPEKISQIRPLRFAYESTGKETFFTDISDPDCRSRHVFAFHNPETLKEWLNQGDTLRARLRRMPPLITVGLWDCQIDSLTSLEKSFAESRPRALVQMATGSGKTFMAVNLVYRLIKFANARRVLFLVDRSNLGNQTLREFQQYVTPDDGRKFTELYNVQHLNSNHIDSVSRVCITTIQRLYSMLQGEEEIDVEIEERSPWESPAFEEPPKEVQYNPNVPPETFDVIIADECHRSIYHLWRQVPEYFDAFIVGLTATPSMHTLAFFEKNLVTEYRHERAVVDGVNVGYEVYRIATKISAEGNTVDVGYYVAKRDKQTRQLRWGSLEDEVTYTPSQLDRDVVAPDQIRTIIRTFKEQLFNSIFPGRTVVPKTLVFAKDDSHAEDIVRCIRKEFGKGNEFCKKITYKTSGEKPEDLIASFRNSYNPRIAVTVDMISTGTDIKPIECLIFMRDVRSPVYFEQMIGRGTRTISLTDLAAVTPDAGCKTHFVVVDAVGVCESVKVDSQPLERKHGVSFEKLIESVALGVRDDDTLSSLASRLATLDREINERDRKEIEVAAGKPLTHLINALLDALSLDKQEERAREIYRTESPNSAQVSQAGAALTFEACEPFDNAGLRGALVDIKRRHEQLIDESIDKPLYMGWSAAATERAKEVERSFASFLAENKDKLVALQIIYGRPYKTRHLTYEAIRQLADAIESPPYNLTPELLWKAYEQLGKTRVRGAGAHALLADIISLVRYAIGQNDYLEPFSDIVHKRFDAWISSEIQNGRSFTPEQTQWLKMIRDHVAASAGIESDDLDNVPFEQRGGRVKAWRLFGDNLDNLLEQLNGALTA